MQRSARDPFDRSLRVVKTSVGLVSLSLAIVHLGRAMQGVPPDPGAILRRARDDAPLFPLLALAGLSFIFLPWLPSTSSHARRAILWLYMTLQVVYLAWRLSSSLPAWHLDGRSLYCAVVLVLEGLLVYATWKFSESLVATHHRGAEADAHATWYADRSREPPLVDVLIPTFNETWPILEKTIVGALLQTFRRTRIWVCDDGKRSWLREKVGAMGIGYLCRDHHENAKSGNLNHAIEHLCSLPVVPEFIAVLDADFIARPAFIARALALMHDPEVGIVQTPQYFLNPDPFQASFKVWNGWPDCQRFAFDVVLPSCDAKGYAYCTGTSFLARVKALREMGGFPTESLTEDMLTSVQMGMHGYRTVYLHELLTTGLAPEGLREYLTQRARWCLGSIQVAFWLAARSSPRTNFFGRLRLLEIFLRWIYSAFVRTALMAIPLVYWYTGVMPFDANAADVAVFALPAIFVQRVYVGWLSRGTYLPMVSHTTNLLASFAMVPAVLRAWIDRSSLRFVVTGKGELRAKLVHRGPLLWLVVYGALLIFGIVYRLLLDSPSEPTSDMMAIALLWSVVNLVIVGLAIPLCIEAPKRRAEYRYSTDEFASLEAGDRAARAKVKDLSVSGASIETELQLVLGESIRLEVAPFLKVTAQVVRKAGERSYGVAFRASDAGRRALIAKIFCSDVYVRPATTGSLATVAWALVRALAAMFRAPAASAPTASLSSREAD